MLHLFKSASANRFHVTLLDIDGNQLPKGALLSYAQSNPALRSLIGARAAEVARYLPNRHLAELKRSIAPLLEQATARQHNVIIRPVPTHAAFIQLDDPPQESAPALPAIKRLPCLKALLYSLRPSRHTRLPFEFLPPPPASVNGRATAAVLPARRLTRPAPAPIAAGRISPGARPRSNGA